MAEDYKYPESVQSLPVLPHSGKVEQLRQEALMSNQNSEDRVAEATQPTAPEAPAVSGEKSIEYKLLEGKVIAALSSVYDPEIPVNIYELGLIYKIEADAESRVHVDRPGWSASCRRGRGSRRRPRSCRSGPARRC